VSVENSRPDIATANVLARLDEALALIERYQPWRLRHLRRDLNEIRIVRFPCRGAWLPEEGACVTELTFLNRRDISPAPVASSIVHEGMHARVDRMGVSRYTRDRAREERLCRRAELEFGQSLPPELGAPVVERALESLTLADEEVAPAIDWSERCADRTKSTAAPGVKHCARQELPDHATIPDHCPESGRRMPARPLRSRYCPPIDEALVCHVAFTVNGATTVIPTLHARRGDALLLHGPGQPSLQHIADGNRYRSR
jgi:hypothetical protein